MDSVLSRRWKQNEMPFNQMVLYPKKPLSLPQLSTALVILVDSLSPIMPYTPLLHFLDWHEHDFWISPSTPTTWDTLLDYSQYLLSPIAIEGAYLDDTDVYHAFYAQDFSFLLRADTFSEEDYVELPWDGAFGTFDFTASLNLISKIRVRLEIQTHLNFTIEPAKPYFDRKYAG